MKNKFLVLTSSLLLLFSVTSCNAFTASGGENPPSEGGGEGGEVDPPLPVNTKSNPYTIDQMIQAMKDLSEGAETSKDYYVKGKAVNVSFSKRWSSYSCYFEGHEQNSAAPLQLYGGMLSLSEIPNTQNVDASLIEGTEITFYGRAKMTKVEGKKTYTFAYFDPGSAIDPTIYKIDTDIPGMDGNWKTPGEGKVDIKQTYKTFSGNAIGQPVYTPQTGEPKLLVIPLWYSNSNDFITNEKKESVRQDIIKAFDGQNEDTGWRSVKTYYEEESGNKLKPRFYVQDFLDIDVENTYFQSVAHVSNNVEILVSWYCAEHPEVSRSDFDSNGDGFLDGVIFVNGARKPDGWSSYVACLDYAEADLEEPSCSMYMWVSVFDMYGSNFEEHTGVHAETHNGGYTEHCLLDASVYIHEMGHMLGAIDYYDYSHQYSPAGDNTMQDYNVGGHDPYSVMAYGWADPYIPSESCTIEIGAFQSTKDLILLTPHWNKQDSAFDEYLLLELYTPTGLNEFNSVNERFGYTTPTEAGIRLWHVDARLTSYITKAYCENLTTDAEGTYLYDHAMSNTYYSSGVAHLSRLGPNYYDYNLLQYIRNDESSTYKPKGYGCSINNNNLFKDGDSFDMNTFGAQFKNNGKLNSGEDLGWSFSVSISGEGSSARASVTLMKA